MKFLVILTIVLVYKYWSHRRYWRDQVPFVKYQNWFLARSLTPRSQYLLCVGLPVLAVFTLSVLLATGIWTIFWLLLSLIVLGYSIGNNNLGQRVTNQGQWLRGLSGDEPLAGLKVQQDQYLEKTTYANFQGIYPVIFWFLLVGPAGALAYGLSRMYLKNLGYEDSRSQQVEAVLYWMEWLPARLTGFMFALLGNFGRCFDAWVAGLFDVEQSHSEWLCSLLGMAIDKSDYQDINTVSGFVQRARQDLKASKELLERSLFGWLGLAAILAIVGW